MNKIKKNTFISILVSLSVLGLFLFVLDIFIGSVSIPLKSIFNILFLETSEKESWKIIILQSRLPKALAAVLCGAALAVSGLNMQSLFKNPLAGPYILGISSGASLGVAIFIMGLSIFGITLSNYSFMLNYGLLLSSILGSLLVLLILLSAIIRIKDIMTVLILGIMIGSIITAIVSIFQFFSPANELKSFILWTMGDLSSITINQLKLFAPTVFIGIFGALAISKKLNLYLLGESYAKTLGLDVKKTQLTTIIITSILAGSVTAFCGPIGFVGIVVPHFARLLIKSSDHKKLIPLSVVLGINVLLLADILSSLPHNETTLPINALTSFIGIPFIFWIILKNKKVSNSF